MGGSWEDHGKNAQVAQELSWTNTEVMPKELRGHSFSKKAEFFVLNENNFVILHPLSRDRKCKQEKHYNTVLTYRISPKFKQEDGAFVLSLVCVCYCISITSGVRCVP